MAEDDNRLGTPIPLEHGTPIRLSPDDAFSHESMQKRRREERQKAGERFSRFRFRCLGDFDTKLPCVCAPDATILDRATEVTRAWNGRIGSPGLLDDEYLTYEDLKAGLEIQHRYFCQKCGLVYENSVIEGVRVYIPREAQPDEE